MSVCMYQYVCVHVPVCLYNVCTYVLQYICLYVCSMYVCTYVCTVWNNKMVIKL